MEKEVYKLINMQDVEAVEIEWLWKPYIPLGKLAIIQGDGGEGKTTFILRVASMMSKGEFFDMDGMDMVNVLIGADAVSDYEFIQIQERLQSSLSMIYLMKAQILEYEADIDAAFAGRDPVYSSDIATYEAMAQQVKSYSYQTLFDFGEEYNIVFGSTGMVTDCSGVSPNLSFVEGLDGHETIVDSSGNDRWYYMGSGNDTVTTSLSDSADNGYIYYKGDGIDTIYDYQGTDVLYLVNFFADVDEISVDITSNDDFVLIQNEGNTIIRISKKRIANSGDSFQVYYDGGFHTIASTVFDTLSNDNLTFILAQCPVDVEIYDAEDTLVYTIENADAESVYTDFGDFHVMAEGDTGNYQKLANLYEEGYYVILKGTDAATDESTMDYTITTVDSTTGTQSYGASAVSITANTVIQTSTDTSQNLSLSIDADGDGNTDTVVPLSQYYRATVADGTGGGDYFAGETVSIALQSTVEGQTFSHWSASDASVVFADATNAETTFTMPEADVTISAVFVVEPVSATWETLAYEAGTVAGVLSLSGLTQDGVAVMALYKNQRQVGIVMESLTAGTEQLQLDIPIDISAGDYTAQVFITTQNTYLPVTQNISKSLVIS